MEKLRFLKTDQGRLSTPDLVYCFFELVSLTDFLKLMETEVDTWMHLINEVYEHTVALN